LLSRSRAAAPATWGEDADVPAKPEPHPDRGPYTLEETASGATMSGLIRWSISGPVLLYGCRPFVAWHTAPTVRAAGEVAGSHTSLPVAASIAARSPSMNRSRRGVALPFQRLT
jgi:hypothetical protein